MREVAVVESLLKEGANKDSVRRWLDSSSNAIEFRHVKVVELLLRAGADTKKDYEGQTILDIARETKDAHLIEIVEAACALRAPLVTGFALPMPAFQFTASTSAQSNSVNSLFAGPSSSTRFSFALKSSTAGKTCCRGCE